MEQLGIIKKVMEPTSWVNSMVVNEKKSGKLRICADPKDLNKYGGSIINCQLKRTSLVG